LLATRDSTATNVCGPARRILSSSTSFLADVFLHVLIGLGSAHTSGKVAAGFFLKFQWSDYPGTGKRFQTWTGRPWSKALVLTSGVGKKLLLVEVHLSLDFVLSVG
jgi:hypothetical protein